MKSQPANALNIVTALKPSLRAALHLVQEFGDLESVLTGVHEGKLQTLAKIIKITSGQETAAKFLHEIATHGAKQIDALIPHFIIFIKGLIADVPALSDTPQTKPTSQQAATAPQKPDAYYYRLFQIGTGVLGWTPSETWPATPTEIVLAYQGRTEFIADILKSVFGTKDENGPQIAYTSKEAHDALIASGTTDPAFDRAAFQELRELQ